MSNTDNKGDFNGLCNITACDTGYPARWYNHSTRKYYCYECAHRLNYDPFNYKDAMRLFGKLLCSEGEHVEE